MQLHATSVAINDKAVLIRGASGSGKSSLALRLMALGAQLISDDRTDIIIVENWPCATAPAALSGMIECRGIGLLKADPMEMGRIHLIIDMDFTEEARLPEERSTTLCGQNIPLLHKVEREDFAAGIRQYLLAGRAMI